MEAIELSREQARRAHNSILSFDELKIKLVGIDLPADVLMNDESKILLGEIQYCGKPSVKYCLVVNDNLEYELWSLGKEVKKGNFVLDEIPSLPSHLNSIAFLGNLVFYLKRISSGENHKPLGNPNATEEAIEILECSNYGTNSKMSFIIEQLTLVSSKPTARKYSSSYLAFAIMSHKISTAAYKHLQSEDILTLPSIRRLRQLTTAIDSDLKLGETATNYLKARNSKLVPKDCIVSLIIDEV